MICDICGKQTDKLYKTEVEGTVLNLCSNCKRFGKVISTPALFIKKAVKHRAAPAVKEEKPEEFIRPDFARIVTEARQRKGLKQAELAKNIQEKASLIHLVESGHHEPSLDLARKLEHYLKISLIQTSTEVSEKLLQAYKNKNKTSSLTLGDVIKIKKKK